MILVEPDPADADRDPSDEIGDPESSTAGAAGWIVPSQPDAQGGRRRLQNGCLVVVALVVVAFMVLPLLATVILDGSSSSGSDVSSLGFGTGGSGCVLSEVASSFPVGVPIRSVLTMEPALSAGDTVAITLEKDGVELVDGRQTITIEEAAPCIYGTLPALEVGRYRMGFDVSSDQMPPIGGEFDVTP